MNLERFVATRGSDWAELQTLVFASAGVKRASWTLPTYCGSAPSTAEPPPTSRARPAVLFPDATGTLRLQALVAGATPSSIRRRQGATRSSSSSAGRCGCGLGAAKVRPDLGGRSRRLRRPRGGLGPAATRRRRRATAGGLSRRRPTTGAASTASRLPAGQAWPCIFVNNIVVAVSAMAGGFTLGYRPVSRSLTTGSPRRARHSSTAPRFRLVPEPRRAARAARAVLHRAGRRDGLRHRRRLRQSRSRHESRRPRTPPPAHSRRHLWCDDLSRRRRSTEGIVTPWDLPTPAALGIGLALAGGFCLSVLWRGRPPSARRRQRRARSASAGGRRARRQARALRVLLRRRRRRAVGGARRPVGGWRAARTRPTSASLHGHLSAASRRRPAAQGPRRSAMSTA